MCGGTVRVPLRVQLIQENPTLLKLDFHKSACRKYNFDKLGAAFLLVEAALKKY